MTKAEWIARGLFSQLCNAAATGLPVTVLVGPRASGKTTLVRRLVDEGIYEQYVSLARADVRAAAAQSPGIFIDGLGRGAVIDEAQLVPELLGPIKEAVDSSGRSGQFLLTGSTRVDRATMAGTNPLAGRYSRFELGTLTAAERHGHTESQLAMILAGDVQGLSITSLRATEYDSEAATSGFPLLVVSNADTRRWRRDYLRSVVPETLAESDHVVDHQRLARLLNGIAGMAGHELVLKHLGADLGIDRRTAARYLDLLEEMRLLRRLPGLRIKAVDTERTTPKLHMADPVLVAADPGGPNDARRGALLESFVVNEIANQLEWIGGADALYHWRDRNRHEVDLVVERDGMFTAVEIKRTREISVRATAGIEVFRQRYRDQFTAGLVMYAGSYVLPLGERVWAVPISALWSS